ncbi:uncharacterized protein LOC141855122 [Brevipalpus obovatus]|uniref:uncharacterized protein LOC141855122 n=1 Tax=Brevipalpus obovatus TaxID=246614 RepID=UPI003D9E3AFA
MNSKNIRYLSLTTLVVVSLVLGSTNAQYDHTMMPSSPMQEMMPPKEFSIHIPLIFRMNKFDRFYPGFNNTNLDIKVLHGLVRVKMDRTRHLNGSSEGPIRVSILGMPIPMTTG